MRGLEREGGRGEEEKEAHREGGLEREGERTGEGGMGVGGGGGGEEEKEAHREGV